MITIKNPDSRRKNPITGQSDIKIGELIVCYPNKYTIISINSIVSIQARNIQSADNVDWIGETYNGREL